MLKDQSKVAESIKECYNHRYAHAFRRHLSTPKSINGGTYGKN